MLGVLLRGMGLAKGFGLRGVVVKLVCGKWRERVAGGARERRGGGVGEELMGGGLNTVLLLLCSVGRIWLQFAVERERVRAER